MTTENIILKIEQLKTFLETMCNQDARKCIEQAIHSYELILEGKTR